MADGGITRGARSRGDSGRPVFGGRVSSRVSSNSSSSSMRSDRKVNGSPWCCFKVFPGALAERSCRGGRPGIVAGRDS